MAEITLKYPDVTAATLLAMREFTGAQDDGRVIQDALRVYEWVLYRQAQGLTVCARGDTTTYCMESFIPEALQIQAVEFFERVEPAWKTDA